MHVLCDAVWIQAGLQIGREYGTGTMNDDEFEVLKFELSRVTHPFIVEVGAHCGEEADNFSRMCKDYLHIMVEPDPRNCQVILSRITVPSNLIIGAVSDSSGFKPFHFSGNGNGVHGSGSLLEPTGHLEHFPEIHFAHTGYVPCYTLDEIYSARGMTKIDLLWIDAQGAESAIIKGGPNALSHTRMIFFEAESVELYEGQVLKPELVAMLPGWDMVRDFGSNVLMRNKAFVPPWGS